MASPNQIERTRDDVHVTAQDLLRVPDGPITERGLRTNISIGIQYLESWLSGNGCVPLYNLMEDAATAEISRAQVWQWIRHPRGVLEDGRKVTVELFRKLAAEELDKLPTSSTPGHSGATSRAAQLFDQITTDDQFADFLTLPGYEMLEG